MKHCWGLKNYNIQAQRNYKRPLKSEPEKSPRGLKPESYKGTSLKAYEERRKNRKRKKIQSIKNIDWPVQGAELGSPRIDKGSGSPRRITQLKVGLRQLTGKRQKKHKKRRGGGGTSFSGTRGSKKSRERRVTIHDASERYLGEP